MFEFAIHLIQLGLYDEAITNLKSILSKDDSNGDACNYIAICYHRKEEYTEAFSWYNRAIGIDPTQYQYFSNRGLCYKDVDQDYFALQDLEYAVKLGQNQPSVLYSIVQVALNMDDFETASQYSHRIWLNSEYNSDIAHKTYRVLIKLGEFLPAAYLIDEIRNSEGDGSAVINLFQGYCFYCLFMEHCSTKSDKIDVDSGMEYFSMGIKRLDRVIELGKHSELAYSLRARMYAKLGFINQADHDISKAISLKPEDDRFLNLWNELIYRIS